VIARLTGVACALLALAAAFVWMGAKGAGPQPYRVDAIFDNADFLVSGQDVKIAGAVEGSVKAVRLTPDHRARIEMEVRREFGPFRANATCSIRPESLIGEKFVDCDPGTPSRPPLVARGDSAPTVPLARNHSPVDLDLVLAALRLPYRERLTLLVNELGVGLAGRPADLNAAIRRANPAIQRANDVLTILNRDRGTLGHLIDASDTVLAELAAHRGDVRDFIGRADRVAQAVASRRGDLGLAIDRLPPMLDRLEPTANELNAFAGEARPVANDLHSAARPLADLLGDFGPLTDAARPTLVKLGELARTGRSAIRSTAPVAAKLLPIARRLPETAQIARDLNDSLKARGVPEGLLSFLYYGTAAVARFDRFSHILPSYQIAGTCQQYATQPVDGCDAHFGTAAGAARTAGKRRDRHVLDYLMGR
jgi:phospholipid/cholesterol/gamma-HCH transport system substrate-binding protein